MSVERQILVTITGAKRIDARVGPHVIQTDQPIENGGTDSAPSPFDLFLASIGTCAGLFVQGFCSKRGIPTDDIRIGETPKFNDAGNLLAVELSVALPASFPDKYREALVRAVDGCSVKQAIAAKPAFTVTTTKASLDVALADEDRPLSEVFYGKS